MIKIFLVDDEASVRQGLRMRLALEPDLLVVGEAGDGVAAIQAVQALGPDVVVTDVDMPKMDGITRMSNSSSMRFARSFHQVTYAIGRSKEER